eukprot:TRINITY_DN3945_c0_g1_i16.p3 TRINITY_DN3945_c0_g1~~TRINITY_DN3945_c0_g1_i16.p3  ORF type:complete len:169 (-),score=29.54 TRINITY_DN3945_c0_g1_i16:190-696(-)
MSSQGKFENVLLSDRSTLSAKESMQRLINYALVQDNRSRARKFTSAKSSWLLSLLLFTYPVLYVGKGFVFGCWDNLRGDFKLSYTFGGLGRPYRMLYRPEVYFRDSQYKMLQIDQVNQEKERRGEKPTLTSPVVLWNQRLLYASYSLPMVCSKHSENSKSDKILKRYL